MACGSITLSSNPDCDALPKGGTRARAIAYNFDEVDSYTIVSNVVTAITLITGATGYQYVGFRNDVKKSEEVINNGIGLNQFKHTAGWVIYERTQVIKDTVERLARGRFVVIVENKGRDTDAFEVIGIGAGVEIVAGAIRNAHENGGFFLLNFATPEGEFESKLPQTYYDTSYSNSLSEIEATLYLPSITNLNLLAASTGGGQSFTVTGTNFFGGGAASAVSSAQWVNQSNQATTTQTSLTVSSTTTITFTSVALTAGTYKLRVTTTKGVANSVANVVVS